MPLPRGVHPDNAVLGYMTALQGLPLEAIVSGIRKFLRGSVEGVSTTFCPRPPELASIVRDAMPAQPTFQTSGRLYGYRAPRTKVIERRCTKDWARQLVHQGVHPRGSIWCPGPITDRPDIGDLYAPDADWRQAKPLVPEEAAA